MISQIGQLFDQSQSLDTKSQLIATKFQTKRLVMYVAMILSQILLSLAKLQCVHCLSNIWYLYLLLGITLQKIVRPSPVKGPPKLTYHGPKSSPPTAYHFGSIEITPMSSSDSNNCLPKTNFSSSSSLMKISGKSNLQTSRKMPNLVQLNSFAKKSWCFNNEWEILHCFVS